MSELIWLPAGFLSVFLIAGLIDLFASKKKGNVTSESPEQASIASIQIIDMTTTNNDSKPIYGMFEDLERESVRDVLGGELDADMSGYMP